MLEKSIWTDLLFVQDASNSACLVLAFKMVLLETLWTAFSSHAPVSKIVTGSVFSNYASASLTSTEICNEKESSYIQKHTSENGSSGTTNSRPFPSMPFGELCSERLVLWRHRCSPKHLSSKISFVHYQNGPACAHNHEKEASRNYFSHLLEHPS